MVQAYSQDYIFVVCLLLFLLLLSGIDHFGAKNTAKLMFKEKNLESRTPSWNALTMALVLKPMDLFILNKYYRR